jgi:hypothetical protein
MAQFTIKEGNEGRCFLVAEGFGVTVALHPPSDMAQAEIVKAVLNKHVKDITVESGVIEISGEGASTHQIGGEPMSLLGGAGG